MLKNFFIRLDGRTYNEIRPFKISYDPINSSLSSVQVSTGLTTVIISINRELNYDENNRRLANVDFNLVKYKKDKNFKSKIKKTIRKIVNNIYPWDQFKKRISLHIAVIEEDGDFLSVVLNGIFLAIENAAFFSNMKVFCTSISLLKNYKNLIANPISIEELFVSGYYYFIKIKYTNKQKSLIKIFYHGESILMNDPSYKHIIEFGKLSVNLFEKSIKYQK
jgi:ribonuclease PH